jgi:hypothetical protein
MNDFEKPPVPQVFYMPTWTKAELEVIAPSFPNVNHAWCDRLPILGGIPPYVLEDTKWTPTVILEAACKICLLDDCIKEICLDSIITEKSEGVHSLVHVTSVSPYTESSVCYASPTALNIIVQRKVIEARRNMQGLLASCEGNPLTATLCGYVFEPYAIELLERGDTFTCRQLVNRNTKIQPIYTTLIILLSKKIVVDHVLCNQTLNQFYVPKTKKLYSN